MTTPAWATVSPDALAQSQALYTHLLTQLNAAGGWLSFADFMHAALYTPALGYYSGGSTKFGAAGDFVTAPVISPLFAHVIARQLAPYVATNGGLVIEFGAGTGLLAQQLLSTWQAMDCLPSRYVIVEVSGELAARQADLLAPWGERVEWWSSLPSGFTGVVVGNEVLDAMPVELVVKTTDGWLQRGVGCDDAGRWQWHDRPLPDSGALADAVAQLPADLPLAYVTEIGLAAQAFVTTLAERLHHGLVLLIDYGFGAGEFYHPQRAQGTLMCHYQHRAHTDPFCLLGLQDITAHVNFSAVAQAAVHGGCDWLGYASQAEFLIHGGITQCLSQQADPQDVARYAPLVAGVQKLLSPAEMGELFKVAAFGRGVLPPAALSVADRSYRL